MLNLKFNFLKFIQENISPNILGVDIGTTSIKVVEVGKGELKPKILNYAILENKGAILRTNAVFQASNLKLFESEVIYLLKEIIKRINPKTKKAVASLPLFSSFTTILHFPEMPDNELKQALVYQAKQYVPLPLSEIALDWQKIGEYENEKGFKTQLILLIAVPQETIKKYQDVFRQAGLSLLALEIEPISLLRSLISDDKVPTIIIDIGSHTTSISLVEDLKLKFVSHTDFAGSSLTHAISSALNINPLRAEEIKREHGILSTGANYELTQTMIPFIDIIINEVKRALISYENNFFKKPNFERVILSGGGANLLGLDKYISNQLNIPTVKAEAFLKFEYNPELLPLLPELNPLLAVALGLTLRMQ
jgi:type IV pilus assembly protein PilM